MQEPVILEDSKPERRDEKPLLRTERNRWFFAVLSFSVVFLVFAFLLFYAFEKAQNNKEVVFVKLEPNGAWSVVDYLPQDEQLYFKTTIDALLQRFAKARYGLNPETIETDWGEASVFMSKALADSFVSPRGFDALGKIDAIRKLGNKADIDTSRGVEHYDDVNWKQGDAESVVVRSNIYLTRTLIKQGRKQAAEKLVLNVQWQLKDKTLLASDSMDVLRINPLGLTILSYQLNKERSE
ncbi:VirB8/TrbF family protein [Vibrio alfacsensis]|uniref:VirB8/TrbF family protein n=1 Tax=Vibrio alfacsensis TaxID=1074311 RepID=UPI00406821CA